jgi:cytoskeletal protein RodZ
MGQFGDKFRKAREAKELTLDDVSNVTKIGPRMLQAIEEENFDRLPGGVFNKGFIRAYAKHLGLDADEAITEYLECLHQAQVAAQQAWEPAVQRPGVQTEVRPAPPVKELKDLPKAPASVPNKVAPAPVAPAAVSANKPVGKPQPAVELEELPDLKMPREGDVRPPARTTYTPTAQTGSTWRLIVVAGLIFILGVALWTRRSHPANSSAASSNPSAANSPSTAPATPPPVAPAQNSSSISPASTPPTNSAALVQLPPANPQPQPQKSNAPATMVPMPATSSESPSVEEKNDVTIRKFDKAAQPKPSETTAASFTLVIRATENSWLSIVADGQPVRQETLIAPAHTSVHASREVVVKVGNAAGVSFLFNGKEISPQGTEAVPRTLVFDSSGLKAVP